MSNTDNELMEKIYDYLEEHKNEDLLSVEKIAEDLKIAVPYVVVLLAGLYNDGLAKIFVRIRKLNEYTFVNSLDHKKAIHKDLRKKNNWNFGKKRNE